MNRYKIITPLTFGSIMDKFENHLDDKYTGCKIDGEYYSASNILFNLDRCKYYSSLFYYWVNNKAKAKEIKIELRRLSW